MADRHFLVDSGLCPSDKAVYTGNGIDIDQFSPEAAAAERAGARAEFGFRPEETVVLTVGRFVEDKGYRDLMAAIDQMAEPLERVRFLWVAPVLPGEGRALSADVIPERIRRTVTVVPRRDDMVRLYGCADLLVHPSHREGASRVLMEASAVGLPIIASQIAGNREVADFGETATGYPVGDSAALAGALDKFLRDPEPMRSMARIGHVRAAERFNVPRVMGRNWAVYRSLGLSSPGNEPDGR